MSETASVLPETRLLLVRHGRTDWNNARRVQGHTDLPLDEVGWDQAKRLALRLASERIDAVYSSDLSRAIETARLLAAPRGLPVRTSPRLREVGYGPWEGLTVTEIESRYPEEYRRWREDSLRCRIEGAETLEALQQRAMAEAAEILCRHGGETVAIVAHGGTIRSLICGLLGWPLTAHRQLRTDNASISWIDYSPYGPVLALLNDTAHLEP